MAPPRYAGLVKPLLLTVALSLVLIVLIPALEDHYLYYPLRDVRTTPASAGLTYDNRYIFASDGVRLNGWYIPRDGAHYTVLHFHGNAGNLGHRVDLFRRWHELGLAVFAIDYRGYGNSEGTPSEAGLYQDARAAWDEAVRELGIPPQRLIICGRSLGTAPAARIAAELPAAALVLESPLTNLRDMARIIFAPLPVHWLVRSGFDVAGAMAQIRLPVMVIHAEGDTIIPQRLGREVFEIAGPPKVWVSLAGDHNDFDIGAEQEYLAAWSNFIGALDINHSPDS